VQVELEVLVFTDYKGKKRVCITESEVREEVEYHVHTQEEVLIRRIKSRVVYDSFVYSIKVTE
jgi:hypothetical protein